MVAHCKSQNTRINKVEVIRFFDLLKYKFSPNCIYNADETYISTVPNKQPKILPPTVTATVAKVVSGERGKKCHCILCDKCLGIICPPVFHIWKSKDATRTAKQNSTQFTCYSTTKWLDRY